MPMTLFMSRFPELGARETRSATVAGMEGLPDGKYDFVEFYCDEPGCDCRRVIIGVLRPETGWSKTWATISYGWESPAFYRKWGGAFRDPADLKGPFLDPLNAQTEYSHAVLELFRFVLQAPGYVERLKNHYWMFRAAVETERANKARRQAAHRGKPADRRKRRR